MTKSSLSIVLAVATLATAAGFASTSVAAEQHTVSTIVRYGDLNLANPDGARAVLTRIKHAARQVCEPAPESALEYDDWRKCMAKATDGAVARLNAPMVTAAYSGKQPTSALMAQNESR
jgi:UrcA family protein